MRIKTKLLLGFGALFLVVVFFGIVSVYYIEDISENSKTTVKNNYETLTFTRDMRAVLDENDLPLTAVASQAFDKALQKQEHNITETGEQHATAGVRKAFTELTDASLSLPDKQKAEREARLQLKVIEGLNMKAIVAKNNYIHDIVSKATLYLGGIVFVTFLILFVFIVNFPGFILNPLNEFIEGVHEIREKHYDARLEFKTNDEFAALAVEFNAMAAHLSKLEGSNQTKILSGESQIRILIEQVPDAVIGVDEKGDILFLNKAAAKILKTGEKNVNGQPVASVVTDAALLKAITDVKEAKGTVRISMDGKSAHFQLKNFEIVVPNLKTEPFGTLQFSGFAAGMVFVLKHTEKTEHDEVKTI